jgi:hypothetical protein
LVQAEIVPSGCPRDGPRFRLLATEEFCNPWRKATARPPDMSGTLQPKAPQERREAKAIL